jgi:hypothetical protein
MKKALIFFILGSLFIPKVYSQEAFRRWRKTNQIRLDKFHLILPEAMRENKIDMWIVMNREGNFDPLRRLLLSNSGACAIERSDYPRQNNARRGGLVDERAVVQK